MAAGSVVTRAALAAVLLIAAGGASAAQFCVATAAQFRAALATAGSNGTDDEIRLRFGVYATSDGAATFTYSGTTTERIEISGDWNGIGADECDFRFPGIGQTILDGGDARRVLRLTAGNSLTRFIVSDLVVRRGNAAGSGGGIGIGVTGFRGEVTIERVTFQDNVASASGGGLSVATSARVEIRNNVFVHNAAATNGAVSVNIGTDGGLETGFLFDSNTVYDNACDVGCTTGGLRLVSPYPGQVINNLFADNTGADLENASASLALVANNIAVVIGTAPATSIDNVAFADPGFIDGAGTVVDLRLEPDSPLIDAGTQAFGVPPVDRGGLPRVSGADIDIGAYEDPGPLFRDSFE